MDSSTDLASVAFQQYFNNLCQVCACTLYCYNFCLTFNSEIEFIWPRMIKPHRVNRVDVPLVLLRYLGLASSILGTLTTFQQPTEHSMSCKASIIIGEILEVTMYMLTLVMSALRVFALEYRELRIPLLMVCIGLGLLTVYLYINIHSNALVLPGPLYGCVRSNSLELPIYTKLSNGYRLCILTNDALLIVITLRTCLAQATGDDHFRPPIATYLVKDAISSTPLWLLLLAVGIAQIIAPQTNVEFNPLQTIFDTLNSLLLPNYFMELREVFLKSDIGQVVSSSPSSRPSFTADEPRVDTQVLGTEHDFDPLSPMEHSPYLEQIRAESECSLQAQESSPPWQWFWDTPHEFHTTPGAEATPSCNSSEDIELSVWQSRLVEEV